MLDLIGSYGPKVREGTYDLCECGTSCLVQCLGILHKDHACPPFPRFLYVWSL